MREIPLNVDVGSGWRALRAHVPDVSSGSMALLTFGKGDVVQHARLDLGKHILIDRAPTDVSSATLASIIDHVAVTWWKL